MYRTITVIAATRWETEAVARALRLKPLGQGAFAGRIGAAQVRVQTSGMGQSLARTAAERLMKDPVDLVIVTGFAGSLRNDVLPGDLVLDAGRSAPSLVEHMVSTAEDQCLRFHRGTFWSDVQALSLGREKRAVGLKTGAIAVETEGQAVFQLCQDRGIAFCSMRAVSDGCTQSLPSSVRILDADGGNIPRFLLALLARPWEWPDFLRLVRGSAKAKKTLERAFPEFIARVSR